MLKKLKIELKILHKISKLKTGMFRAKLRQDKDSKTKATSGYIAHPNRSIKGHY